MKCKLLSLMMAMLLVFSSGIWSCAAGKAILNEGFEEWKIGQFPEGYKKSKAQVVELAVDPINAANKAVYLKKTNLDAIAPDDMGQLDIQLPLQKNKFVVESDVLLISGDFWLIASQGDTFPYGPGLSSSNKFAAFNGADIKSLGVEFTKQKWHKVTVEINPIDSTYLILLDGSLLTPAPIKFRNGNLKAIDTIAFRTPSGKTPGEFYIDNIKFMEGAVDLSGVEVLEAKSEVPFTQPKSNIKQNNPVMKEFYVSISGNDSGDGSKNAPFATIEKAKQAVRTVNKNMTGDIVINILPGDYFVEKTIEYSYSDSGSNGFDVVYRAVDGPLSVRLIGAKKLVGWTKDKENIWKVSVDHSFYTLYENNQRAIKARYPNKAFDTNFPVAKAPYLRTVDPNMQNYKTIMYDKNDLGSIAFSDIADASIVIWPWNKCDWHMWVNPILSVDKANGIITPKFTAGVEGGAIGVNIPFGLDARYYIEGMYELLDAPGEFHLDTKTNTLYYWPYEGDPNAQTEVFAPTVQTIIKVAGTTGAHLAQNLVFDGLSLEKTDFVRGMRGWFEADSPRIGTMDMTNAQNIKITGCRFKNTGLTGLFMHTRSGQNYVSDCLFEDIGNSGIIMQGNKGESIAYNTIENVLIHDIGQNSIDCAGINLVSVQNNTITNVEVYNSPRYGISVRGGAQSFQWYTAPNDLDNEKYSGRCRNNIIKNIKLYKTNQDSGDTAALHTAGVSFERVPYNTNYYENIYIDDIYAHPSMKDAAPNGIYGDYQTFGQSFKNIKVTNQNGYTDVNRPDVKYKDFLSYSQLRYNESGLGTFENCSWYPGFDEAKMDYENMGITKDFPLKYLPEYEKVKDTVILLEGASSALVNGITVPIDPDNPAVMPTNISDRVLVPIRFIAECFGAKVSWDETTETAIIQCADQTISLTIGSKVMKVGDKSITLDVPADTMENRIFVPIRAVSEALGKDVFYDRGQIVLSDQKDKFSPEKDKFILDRIGKALLLGYDISKFQYEAVNASKLREFSTKATLANPGDGIMIRNGGAPNSSMVAISYLPEIGLRLYKSTNNYRIPEVADLGINELPVDVQMIYRGERLLLQAQGKQIYDEPCLWQKPLVGTYSAMGKMEKLQIQYGEIILPDGDVKGIDLVSKSEEMEIGQRIRLVTNALSTTDHAYNLSEDKPIYTSSNPSVLEMQGDEAVAKSEGEATISSSIILGGKQFTDSVTIRVVDFKYVLINETFDAKTFNPNNWKFVTDGLDGSYVKVSEEGTLEIFAANSKTPHMASRSFDNFDGIVTIEFDFKAEFDKEGKDTGAMLAYFLGNAGNFCISTFAYPGKFSYFADGKMTDFGKCESGVQYKVKLVADVKSSTFDIYIDDALQIEDAKFRIPATSIAGIQMGGTANAKNTKLWWDNIKVSKKK